MQQFSKWNKGYRYLLMVLDVFSKYGWIVPLKDKKGETVAEAFKKIFKEGRKPQYLWVDKGKEYHNKHVKELLDSSIGNGGIGTKCAETTTRKKCAKIPRSNISGMCGMSGMPRSNFPRSNISGIPRSNFPRSNGKIKMTKKKWPPLALIITWLLILF